MQKQVMLKSRSWMVLWRPTRPSKTNTPKRCFFHYRGLKYNSKRSRNTWSNSHIWVTAWSTEWIRAKANRVLPRERTGHSKYRLSTTQETTYGRHDMVNSKIRLILFFAVKHGEGLYSQQKQDQELTVSQIMKPVFLNSDLNWRK